MNKIVKLLVWASLLFVILSCVGCKSKKESKPILKVITNSEITPVIFSYDRYYVVYDNGETKKTSEFEPSESVNYQFVSTNYDSTEQLSGVDTNTKEGAYLNTIAGNIISLVNEDNDLSSPGAMYLINNEVYFSTIINKGNNGTVALFIYNESNNTIKKFATFKGNITHVEAYQ